MLPAYLSYGCSVTLCLFHISIVLITSYVIPFFPKYKFTFFAFNGTLYPSSHVPYRSHLGTPNHGGDHTLHVIQQDKRRWVYLIRLCLQATFQRSENRMLGKAGFPSNPPHIPAGRHPETRKTELN